MSTTIPLFIESGLELGHAFHLPARQDTRHSRMRLNKAKYEACLATIDVSQTPLRFFKDMLLATYKYYHTRDMRSV